MNLQKKILNNTLNYLKMEFTNRKAFDCLQPELMLPSEALDATLDFAVKNNNPFEYTGGNVTVTFTVAMNYNNNADKYNIFPDWLNFEPIKNTHISAEISESELREILGEDYAQKISNDYEGVFLQQLKNAVLREIDIKDIRNSEEQRSYTGFLIEKSKWNLTSDNWIKEERAVNAFHALLGFVFYKNN